MEAVVVILVLLAVSVVLGLPGSSWGAVLPGAVALLGVAFMLAADSSSGAQVDPGALAGFLFAVAGGGSAVVVLAVSALVRHRRAERERLDNRVRAEI